MLMMTPEQINTIIATQKKNDENFSAKDISDTEVYNDVISQSTVNIKTIQPGDVFPTNSGGSVTVTRVGGWDDIDVRHNDIHGYITTVYMSALKIGQIKNPYHPKVYGVGYVGVGPYVSGTSHQKTIEYEVWKDMLRRCYCTKNAIHSPTYVGCTVDPIWHNFQNFAHWYCYTGYYNIGYQLDKDLLVQGNRIYSPNTCTMLPAELNSILQVKETNRLLPTGVFKTNSGYKARFNNLDEKAYLGTFNTIEEAHQQYRLAKKRQLIKLASKYEGSISMIAYQALLKTILNT